MARPRVVLIWPLMFIGVLLMFIVSYLRHAKDLSPGWYMRRYSGGSSNGGSWGGGDGGGGDGGFSGGGGSFGGGGASFGGGDSGSW